MAMSNLELERAYRELLVPGFLSEEMGGIDRSIVAALKVLSDRLDAPKSSGVSQIASYPTQTTIAVGTSSILVLAANTNRKHAKLFNRSSARVWLGMGVPAEVGKSIAIEAGQEYEIDQTRLFTGVINAIAESGTVNLAIAEGVGGSTGAIGGTPIYTTRVVDGETVHVVLVDDNGNVIFEG